MGLSGVKILLVLAVIGILFLPMILRHLATIPALLDRTRAALGGEDEAAAGQPARAAGHAAAHEAPPTASVAERLGHGVGRLLQRLGAFRAG